ncbi:TIGR04282 family arsenosugar biosynthesis glycosyltransferase [Halomonas sp. TRM85114]|uniref:TIGR04282 family arsenosugar biosynthesis glycosyltransferase n=1 Tax=Halomonas jincaotanensis TaxID=2810616 RepID=UPI001BD2A7EC|nr:TIGR04282 family arsenosugar biosynthesis glycosyltransferase [Halomonas jincaotanensis]MBS9402845.1 TIGR04282 family arsenosugar biosynthesis glycosyltransferase [Halomonas jincaotanensis]
MCADARDDLPLAILAKAPIPGMVKTRLIPTLGAEGACRLHERLLRQTLEVALATTSPRCITLWTALDHVHPLFLALADRHGITLRAQPEVDLGGRMHHALLAMGEPGLLIGSDCPALTPALLRRCQTELASVDAVFLPAEDGGFALVGLNRPEARLFAGIDWGTDRVMVQTRWRVAALDWQLACPAVVWDVDRPEDLSRLADIDR